MKPNPKSRHLLAGATLAGVTAVLSSAAFAADNNWTGTVDQNWNDPGNWSSGWVPANPNPNNTYDDAIVNMAAGNYPYLTADVTVSPRDVIIGRGAGNSGRVDHVSGNQPYGTNGGWFYVGIIGGTGVYNLADVTTAGGGVTGYGQGTGSLTGGGNIWIGGIDWDTGGVGTMNVNTTGTVTANGNLIIGSSNNAGSPGNGTLNIDAGTVTTTGEMWVGDWNGSQGTLNVAGTASVTVNNWIAVGRRGGFGVLNMTGGTITKAGGGNITISTGTNGTGTINQSGGVFTNTTSLTFLGESWNGDGNGTWNLSGTGQAILGEIIVGNGGASQGTFNLDGGTLTATMIRDNSTGATNFNFNGGTLKAGANQANFMAGLDAATVQGGGAFIDTNGFNIAIAQALVDGGGGLTKLGAGTLTLSGANSYTGLSTVNAGTLVLTTNAIGGGDITVADGAALGVTQVNDTASLAAANVTFGTAGATTLEVNLGNIAGNPTAAPLNVTGTLTLNGTVTINVADQLPALGSVPLVSYVAPIAGAGSITLGTLPNGVIATLKDDGLGLISLDVTSVALPQWTGDVDGTWDIATTQNWIDLLTTLPTTYSDPNPVLFDDNASNTLVTLDVTVAPSQVVFNNSIQAYLLSGTGKITGSTPLLKQGTAAVTISTVNDYTGATTVAGGTLSVNSIANGGAASAIGASTADAANLVLSGGTLAYTGPAAATDRGFTIGATGSRISTTNDLTLSGPVVTSVGNLVKTGAGNLTLTNPGANVFGTVNQGLKVDGGTLTLDGSGTQTNTVAGELWIASTPNVAANVVLNNTSLTVPSWIALGRGNGDTGTLSTITATNSSITSTNFSTGHDAGLANDSDQIVTLTNSTWTNNGQTLLAENANATTTMVIEGSSVYNAKGRFSIGLGDNSLATVTVKDSAQLIQSNGGWVSIGNGGALGTGILNIQDNAVASFSNVDFNVSDVGTSVGTVNVSGAGTLDVAGVAYIGKNTGTSGTVNLSGGSVTMARFVHLGQATGTTGTVTITDGTFTGGGTEDFQIGVNGQGTWTQSGGTTNANSWVAVGRYAGSVGVLTVSGGTFNQTGAGNALLVGEVGTGTLTISGTGAVNSAGNAVVVSNAAEAVGTVNLDGGTLTARQVAAWAGGAGSATVNFNGGLLVAGANANASFINTLDAANVLAGGARIDSNGQVIAIDQALLDGGGGGGLTKTGAGTLALTAANTYVGNTTVNEDTLALADTGSLLFVIGANGVANKVTGPGAATLDGTFTLDLSGADDTAGNSWTLVDVATPVYGPTFSVAGFANFGSGVHMMTDGVKTWTFTEASGTLSVADATAGYLSWAADMGLTAGVNDSPDQDPDADGVSNLMEYVLGGDPLTSDAAALVIAGEPDGLGNFVVTFKRSDLSEGDTTQVLQYGSDLVGWTDIAVNPAPIGPEVAVTEDVPTLELDTITVTIPTGGAPTLFARLKVTIP